MRASFLAIGLLFALLYGCGSTNKISGPVVVTVDVDEAHMIDTRGMNNAVELDSGDSVLLGRIDDFYFVDSVFIINSQKKLSVFDISGDFLGNISRLGRGPDEYLGINDTWLKDGGFYIYDMNGKQVIKYDLNTRAISSVTVSPDASSNPFQTLIPAANGGYVGKMIFQGSAEVSPELAFYDDNFSFKSTIGDLSLNSGLTLGKTFSRYNDEILYWRKLDYTIYSIDLQGNLSAKYQIDFPGRTVPQSDEIKDDYDKIDFINSRPDYYVSLLSDVIETDGHLIFCYIYNGVKYLAVYDKTTRDSASFGFTADSADAVVNIFPVSGDDAFALVSSENNTSVYRINIKTLQHNT